MNKRIIVYVVAALVVLCVICVAIGLVYQSTPAYKTTATAQALATAAEKARPTATPVPTATPPPTGTPKPTDTPSPTDTPAPTPTITATLAPADQLRLAIQTALGDGNRDVPRLREFDFQEGVVWVVWAINDNLFEDLIRDSARDDVAHILEAVDSAGIAYDHIDMVGSFSMKDIYGNVQETDVISLSYNRDTIDRINWEGFSTDNVYDIADRQLLIHPEFAK